MSDWCPACGRLSLTFQSYHGIIMCTAFDCDYVDEESKGPTRINGRFTTSAYPRVRNSQPAHSHEEAASEIPAGA